ncbi:uncharacterized protein [Nicotiana sylvestris]|uniref:uncharacterized protein n=1 Tax=Nicotiana sylvestris TaxID=4096 RepID=UPI00388C9916
MGRIKSMFEQMMKKNADSDAQLASYNTSICNLEVQLGQILQALNTRPKGALPSDTVVNPKGGNNTGHAMAVTTRSGKCGEINTSKQKEVVSDDVEVQNDDDSIVVEQVIEEYVNGEVEALEQIPRYAKFSKDLVTKKRSTDCETIKMTHQVSAIMHSMAPKLEDPGAFIIPCTIGSADFAKALCDLGASINLMPYSVFKTLVIGQSIATSMRLQMADRIMKRPLGIIDDVLVRVNKFILPANFVILDCEVDDEVPIILGRPFLATGKALVDVKAGERTFRVGDEKVVFHVCKSMRQPNSTKVCSFVDLVTEVIVDDTSAMINVKDPLEAVLLNHYVTEDEDLVEKTPPIKPSIEESPVLELKTLPSHLRYEFLGHCSTLPVILSSCLTNVHVDATLEVLQRKKREIGWTLVDIRGISPAFCMHKIILDEDAKKFVEHQRRLNEAMQEVVKKEVIKWIDAGVVTVTGWRVCMDYRKLNKVTRKDHFPLPFLDQMLDLLAGRSYYCFLDGMPFGLCNASATFQWCMMAIFTGMVEDFLEVFMDDFSVVGVSFEECLGNLDKVLARCEETNLVLNWEKCHFMVEEGIVLGHKISKNGIEVDKAKIEVISKLPPPTSVKGVRSFLGHARFYRRFIKDFSKVVNPLCKLLEKDAKFVFNDEA